MPGPVPPIRVAGRMSRAEPRRCDRGHPPRGWSRGSQRRWRTFAYLVYPFSLGSPIARHYW